MSGWHTVLQEASFKGVPFDVERIDERNGKALAEHARPFVSGVDLEDMGNTGREVSISAVFFGRQYSSRLLKLLEALEESGGGVLVHPVWGRMQNMVAASWSYRHEADNVDWAAVDITFREGTEAQPVLVFENHFLMSLERLIARIDTYRSMVEGFIDSVLAVKGGVSDLWGSALGIYSGLAGSFAAVRSLFGFSDADWPFNGGSYSQAAFQTASKAAVRQLDGLIDAGLRQAAETGAALDIQSGGLSVRQRFDEVVKAAESVLAVPNRLRQDRHGNAVADLIRLTDKQLQPLRLVSALSVTGALVEIASEMVEDYGEEMSAPDLMQINRAVRYRIQKTVELLRETEKQALAEQVSAESVYSACHQTVEALRETAGRLNALVIAAINQKPPLIVRRAPLNGTVHQIAFAFYGDIGRADELVRLNPHITHPAFIRRNTLVNAYAK